MKQFIVIFEFANRDDPKIVALWDMIRLYQSFAFVTNNTCIIWANSTVVLVRDHLKAGVGQTDKLFVAEISAPAAWTNAVSKQVSEYLIKNLKDSL